MKFEKIKSIKKHTLQPTSDLIVKNNHNFINDRGIIAHNSGYGKGLTTEAILEEYHRRGYIVICLADPKDEIEMGFAMFEPLEEYHLRGLNVVGKPKASKKVKLYHPFTFRLPKKPLPDINFYTLSLKEFGRNEWSMIAETSWDTDTIKLLLNASQNITNDDGLYGFLHYLQGAVKGKVTKKEYKPDPKNFYLSVSSGTLKSMQDIANYMQPFRMDYFLSKNNSKTLLNWKKILSDQESYHVFFTKWIQDPKLKEFVILSLFNSIIRNKDYATRPIIIYIPEIRFLTPFKPQGYKLFLAQGIKDNLSMMRSMGKGMSSLLDTQVFKGVDEEVRNSATLTLIGELGGASDQETLSKALNYGKSIRKFLSKQEAPNTYIIAGREDVGGLRTWFPSHRHCEPNYNFFEHYRHEYPEQLKEYSDLIDEKKREVFDEEQKYKDRIRKKEDEKKKEVETTIKEKITKQLKVSEVDKKLEKQKDLQLKNKIEQGKIYYDLMFNNPNEKLSYRDIAKRYGVDHKTVKKRIDLYQTQREISKPKINGSMEEDYMKYHEEYSESSQE